MTSFLSRFWNIVRGKTDAVLDRLEKPEEQLSVFVSEMSSQIQDLQSSVASAIADEKRLQKQVESLRTKASDWEERAILALDGGDEELALQAAVKQEACESEAAAAEEGWRAQREATTRLKDSLKLAKHRLEEARRKYNLLLAQYKSAKTKQQIQQTLDAAVDDSPMQIMARLEDKIQRIESEAEAQLVVSAEASDVDLEARFTQIDEQRRGDDALQRIKAKLADRKELGPGGSDASDADALKRELDQA